MTITKEINMSKFGLIGKNIDYSFSKSYFAEKFKIENLDHTYENFDISSISEFNSIILQNLDLKGLNITIPYKEEVIPFLDEMDETAQNIGAVNTVKVLPENRLKGFNTDHWGFQKALEKFDPLRRKTALILGTGGASKSIAYALLEMNFEIKFVSRKASKEVLSYSQLSQKVIEHHHLIVNCTPLGTFPNIKDCPSIPYQFIGSSHFLFDLIYNPSETEFLRRGKAKGAKTSNGLTMLEFQAQKAWEIWNS